MPAKLIFLSGSIRKESFNQKLAKFAYKYAKNKGEDARYIDLAQYEMPIYNGDLEERSGLPENAKKLKQEFINCNGFFIASPEYNSSISPLLKNSLDWISRIEKQGEQNLIAFKGKVAALAAASPGGYGGMRGLVPLRMMLGNIGVTVIPDQVAIPAANTVFDENGDIKEQKYEKMLQGLVEGFIKTAENLKL